MTLQDLFKVGTLTDAINKLPAIPSKVGSLGLFVPKGIPTRTVVIEENQGRLYLVPSASPDANPAPTKNSKRKRRTFEVPHLPTEGVLLPGDLQGLAAFGSDGSVLATQAQVINDKLQEMKNSLEATREWQRIGGLGGVILDADGSVIYDLFAEFGVTKKSISIAFSDDDTDVRKACLDAVRHSESKLGATLASGFKAYCGADFFDALTNHASVKPAYANYQAAGDRLGGDMRKGFSFGGIVFEEYEAQVGGQRFVPADVARVFPLAPGAYAQYNAPANYNETVNTIGLPIYAKAEERRMGKGWDLEAQANTLAMMLFPEALVELKIA